MLYMTWNDKRLQALIKVKMLLCGGFTNMLGVNSSPAEAVRHTEHLCFKKHFMTCCE